MTINDMRKKECRSGENESMHGGKMDVIRCTGFTLIELLVVVTIILILISILLPSLGKAREKTKEISCAGNMKQVGGAIFMYTSDYSEYLPVPKFWPRDIGPYSGMKPSCFSSTLGNVLPSARPNLVFCGSSRLNAPLETEYFRQSYDVTTCNQSLPDTIRGGYTLYYDGVSDVGPGLYESKKLMKVPPSSIIISEFQRRGANGMLWTRYHSPSYAWPAYFNQAYAPDYCHNNRANFLAADGSVRGHRLYARINTDWTFSE